MARGILSALDAGALFRDAPAGGVRPAPGPYDHLPEHDWTQHDLGDPDEWSQHLLARLFLAFEESELTQQGAAPGSTHGAQLWNDKAGAKWLVKPDPYGGTFLPKADVATSQLSAASGLNTPETYLTKLGPGGTPASAQRIYPGAKDAFPGKKVNPEKLSEPDLLTIQKHHALDWLISNHDSHPGQFIRTPEGELVGIDKGQAFKHFGTDALHWDFHPNQQYGETEPVYNTLYRNMARGGRALNDPRQGELGQYLQGLQSLPDEHLRETLRPYAEDAAQAGFLAKAWGNPGLTKPSVAPNDPEAFLDAAVARKNNLTKDFGNLYDKAMAYRNTGTKVAHYRVGMPPPDTENMQRIQDDRDLGSHGSQVWKDPQGEWLFKRPNKGNEFLVPLDVATSRLSRQMGVESPETYAVPFKGKTMTVSKWYPGSQQAFGRNPHLHELSDQDRLDVQKHHVLDWAIANHDAHNGNWLRNAQGKLVGIDKGQALKYFGQDRLDPDFHPNYYAREPIHNQLWREFAGGRPGELLDPREGELGAFVNKLQHYPDEDYKALFRPFAQHAAKAQMLGTGAYGKPGPPDPARGLSPQKIPPNNPEAFLSAMVDRKNNLSADLGAYYDKAATARAAHQQSQAQFDPSHPEFQLAHPPPKGV